EEAEHGAREVREAVHVVALLEHLAIDHRREHEVLRAVVLRDRADERVEALEHVLEHVVAAERALCADRDDQAVLDEAVVELLRIVVRCRHYSSLNTRSIDALLPAMRSLDTISAADSTSR